MVWVGISAWRTHHADLEAVAGELLDLARLVRPPTSAPVAAPTTLPVTGGADGGGWGAFVLGIMLLELGVGLRGHWARVTD